MQTSLTIFTLSAIISILSSYTTLVLIDRIFDGNRTKKIIWLLIGALVMGTGLFSAHIIAMTSHMSTPFTSFNLSYMYLSYFCSILASFIAFFLLYFRSLTRVKIAFSCVIIGVGIVLSHWLFNHSINEPLTVQFQLINHVLFLGISFLFSFIIIYLFIKKKKMSRQNSNLNIFGAIILSMVFFILHFTEMKTTKYLGLNNEIVPSGIHPQTFGSIISFATILLMTTILLVAFLDHRLLRRERQLYSATEKSEQRYRRLVELSPEPIVVHDGEFILYVNEICLKLMNASSKKELVGKPVMEFIHPKDQQKAMDRMKNIREGQVLAPYELRLIKNGGSSIEIEAAGIGILYNDRPAFQLILRDISKQVKIKKELEDNQQRYQSLFQYNPNPVFSLDKNGVFTEINSEVSKLLGYCESELLDTTFHRLIYPQDLELVIGMFEKVMNSTSITYETQVVSKTGTIISVSITNIPIIIDNQVIGLYGIARVLTQEKEYVHKIEHLAYTDQLTGLPNRAWLQKNIEDILLRAKDRNQSIAFFGIDFDHFKKVNDTLGHNIGDSFLRIVSARLKDCLREQDKIARLGGDEFILIIEDVTKIEASLMAQRILHQMNQPVEINGHELIVSVSIGISLYNDDTLNAETLLNQADLAMYEAKGNGKNTFHIYTKELGEKVTNRLKIENALRRAIEQDELKLYYQPLIDIQTMQLTGLEALLRWNPSFGLISPAEFIPVAEETGLIIQIGEWVAKEACLQIKEWEDHDLLNVPIAINISARQFEDPFFTKKIKTIITDAKINPHMLEIEITESVMMNIEKASDIIEDLRDFGIKIAIDDFGIGYSSLQLITSLEYDTLKLDKSLISLQNDTSRKSKLIGSIIESLFDEKRIIVEGIETKEQLDSLKNYSIIGQGYYFSPPLPKEQLEEKVVEIMNH